MDRIRPKESFGAELLSAPIPHAPEGVDPEKWNSTILANRKLTLSGFTERKLNNDSFNDVLALKMRLEDAKAGDDLSGIPLRLYKDYIGDKNKDDAACYEFVIDNSDAMAVNEFDTEIMNMRSLIHQPLNARSIQEIKNGLRKIYVVMYGREPSHF